MYFNHRTCRACPVCQCPTTGKSGYCRRHFRRTPKATQRKCRCCGAMTEPTLYHEGSRRCPSCVQEKRWWKLPPRSAGHKPCGTCADLSHRRKRRGCPECLQPFALDRQRIEILTYSPIARCEAA